MFCTVSVTTNVVFRGLVAGGAESAVCTKPGRVTVTTAVEEATQLLASSLSGASTRGLRSR
jgi:hypothetical protein